DGRRGRRADARLDRAPGAVQVLLGVAGATRLRARAAGPARRGAGLHARVPVRGARRRGRVAPRAHRPPAERARAGPLARPRGPDQGGGGVGRAARAAQVRGLLRVRAFGARAAARARPGNGPAVGEDRPDRPRSVRRARRRLGLQVGEERALRRRDRPGAAPADPAVHARAARSRRRGAARRALPAAGRRPQGARAAARVRARGRAARLLVPGLRGRRRVLGPGRPGRGSRPGDRGPDPSRRRAARPARWILPDLVRAGPDVPGETGVSGSQALPDAGLSGAATDTAGAAHVRDSGANGVREADPRRKPAVSPVTREQHAAIEAPGLVFVSAGAGTGKTTVLVERFVRAVDAGVDVGSILVITYTERAAAELRARIRARLAGLGRPDLTRDLDGAWISTIHGFCLRLLKQHPFAAGLDPRFRVLDESQAAVLRAEAFDEALTAFCARGEPERLALLSTYGSRGLRRMLTGVYETLRSAGRPLALSLGDEAGMEGSVAELRAAAAASNAAEAARLVELLDRKPAPELLLELSGYAVKGDEDYEQARLAVEQAALNAVAARDRDLLQELLQAFERSYQAAKDRESAVDFEDLQLRARNLLRDHPSIREQEQLRFRQVCVDEFQDTNRLQCELIDLVAREELFFVGDEFQSIYRFRHADVEVFKERRALVGDVLPLTQNWRSRPEVLAVVNHLFASAFGDEFRRLVAAGRFPDPAVRPGVELLVTDKASYRGSGIGWRRGEAKAVARRVREIVESGEATAGEIVLLFAAGTDAELYEEELRAAGLPTYRATGRGYFGQQQVVDLLAYLRLLHNRYDDEALVTVLASPFVGVSNDALVLLRRAAPRRPLFTGIEKGLPAGLDEHDARLFQAFRQRYDRLAALAVSVGLERL